MRLWTLHPMYLDACGLVAVWREGLLALAVVAGRTKGYTRHPQLARFKATADPLACVDSHLSAIHDEASSRGYRFDKRKIERSGRRARLTVTLGQVDYEWRHLERKVAPRDQAWLAKLKGVRRPKAHPLFRLVPGGGESWEIKGTK